MYVYVYIHGYISVYLYIYIYIRCFFQIACPSWDVWAQLTHIYIHTHTHLYIYNICVMKIYLHTTGIPERECLCGWGPWRWARTTPSSPTAKWVGLDWIGFSWIGLGWDWLDSVRFCFSWAGLDSVGLGSIKWDAVELDWIALDWIQSEWH